MEIMYVLRLHNLVIKRDFEVNFIGVKIGFMNLGTYIVEVLTKYVIVMTKHNYNVLIAI